MNKKGNIAGVGVFIAVFVMIIVALALFQASAQQVGLATSLSTINRTITAASAGSQYNYTDLRSLGSVTVNQYNYTDYQQMQQ